jgi:hypothetical protein
MIMKTRLLLFSTRGGWSGLAFAVVALTVFVSAAVAQTLTTNAVISTNSVWRFARGTNEASSPYDAWRMPAFNDSGMELGPAPFHFGTNIFGGDDGITNGTILTDMRSNYTCVFIRQPFVVSNAALVTSVQMRLYVDDGFIVWLNGLEIRRNSVASTNLYYTNAATTPREALTVMVTANPGSHTNVVNGTNIFCIQAFNYGATNDDFRIDPEVFLVSGTAPLIAGVSPAPGSSVFNMASVQVTFSHAVLGVDAADLRINGSAATGLSGSGSNYTFTFPPPPSGTFPVTWSTNHGITNSLGIPFNASSITWFFTNTFTPPFVQSSLPAAGATVSNLTQVLVTFDRPVSGVEANDFLINGNAAATVSGSGTNWTFTFGQPPPGLVQMNWDGSHAIYDGNGFRFDETRAGSGWSYTLLDVAAPVVLKAVPVPRAIVTAFTNVEVTFLEPVNGVNAADLLVNGVPAASVIGSGAGPYLFTCASPAAGPVVVSWAVGHGIADFGGNVFAGGAWTNTLNPSLVADLVINEIMAENLNGIVDSDGDTSDWIELHNRGSNAVSLLGWTLTDDAAISGQWTFPDITLGAGQYLLVFASGKDRVTTTGTNHTGFLLGSGEYLGLYNANLPHLVVDEFAPAYPVQRGDISWGRLASNFVYFGVSTPRAPNSAGTNYAGLVERPHASVDSGLFNLPFTLALSCATPDAQIYYTTNGDMPTLTNATLYTGPFTIAGASNRAAIPIRAVAFKSGLLPSSARTRTYIFPEFVISQPFLPAGYPAQWVSNPLGTPNGNTLNRLATPGDYEMDPQVLTNGTNAQIVRDALARLPVVSLVESVGTFFAPTTGVYTARAKQGNQKPVNVEMWLPDGSSVFQADAGFEIQGGTSPTDTAGDWKEKKLSMRLIFRGDFGTPKLKAKLFDDSPVDEFDTLVLDAGMNFWFTHMTDGDQRNRAKFLTDQFTADLLNNAGLIGMRGRYVHVYLNGLYWGLYDLHERMDEAAASSYMGGRKEEWDILKHRGNATGLQNGTVTNYTAMMVVARGLTNAPVGSNAVYEQLQNFLDVPWFIDYMAVNFWQGNTDWPHQNWYCWGGSRVSPPVRWRFVSWDAEHTVRQWDFNFLANANLNTADSPGELLRHLTNNLEFRVLFGDRVHRLMFNGGPLYSLPNTAAFWTPTNPSVNIPGAAYRKRVDEIWDSVVAESARWGDVASNAMNNPYTRELHYTRELNALFTITNIAGQTPNFFPLRGSNVLAQLRQGQLYPSNAAPAFSRHGGLVASGYPLFITNMNGAGTVYFTTNGVDPRVYGAGTVSAQAMPWTGSSLAITRTTTIKARNFTNNTWSALNEATFTVGQFGFPLRVTEIMYNPVGGDAYEFIELLNAGATTLSLGNYAFSGFNFSFPVAFSIAPGQRIVLGNNANTNAFVTRHPGVLVSGWFGGSLDNGGETLALLDPAGNIVLSVSYDDQNGWPTAADGSGYSLEAIDPNADPDAAANWRASSGLNGTPGQPAAAVAASTVVLNEVMADNLSAVTNGAAHPDWIELFNSGAVATNIGGWSLTDDGNARKFVFPTNTVIPAGGFLVVWCDATTNTTPGLHTGFGLGRGGDDVFLYDAATNRVDALSFGSQITDLTIGRLNGAWMLTTPTPGATNAAAALAAPSALSINEWLANATAGGSDWIELFNTSSNAPAALQGLFLGTSNAVIQIRALSFLAPRGYIQIFADENTGGDHLDFKLPAAAGAVVLYDSVGAELQRITYGAQAEGVSQGRLPDGTANIAAFPGSASPGSGNYVINYSGPVLNEVLARNASVVGPFGDTPDFIELLNGGTNAYDLGGMGLSDEAGNVKFRFAPGTVMATGAHLVVWCDSGRANITNGPVLNAGFSLSSGSGGAYLFNAAGQAVNWVEYGFQVADLPIGRSGGQWLLLSNATPGAANSAPALLGIVANLRINEWMAANTNGPDWFELHNSDPLPVALGGLVVTDDPSLLGYSNAPVAALSFIAGGGWVKFVADGDRRQGRDHTGFDLDKDGDLIRVYATNFAVIDSVTFGAQPDGVSQGRLPDGATNIVSFPDTPTPDASNYLPLPDVVINEVLTHTDSPLEDAIELLNTGTNSVEMGGWFISNSERALKKFRVAAGAALAPGAFAVFYENQFNADGSGNGTNFTLNAAHGDAVFVSAADTNGNLTGYRAQVGFGAAANGVSFGRFPTSVGVDFAALASRTFGMDSPASLAQFRTGTGLANSYAKVGPVIINEINYHPVIGGTNTDENADDEFIELHNNSGLTVPLFDPAHPTNTWRLSGGVGFTFSTNTTIPAQGHLIVVGFNPTNSTLLAAFHARFGSNGPVAGPFSGRLDNSGEALELVRPDVPQQLPHPDAGFVPQVVVDRVIWSDLAPWPTAADGGGASLQRLASTLYGNDPANWKAEAPTAGRTNSATGDVPPTISSQPADQGVIAGGTATFTVVANGTAPLSYQWQRAGTNLPGATSSTLTISNVQPADAGSYRVQVGNTAGSLTSQDATLTVLVPAAITTQPQGQALVAGAGLSLFVTASGTGPLAYQWRLNGLELIGENGPTLSRGSVSPGDAGSYSVVVSNVAGSVTSAVAVVTVVVAPTITGDPTDATVLAGTTVNFGVSATGTAPLTYQWQKNGLNIPGATNTTLALPSVLPPDDGFYRAIASNAGGSATSLVARLTVLVPPALSAPQRQGDGSFLFTLEGQGNRTYVIDFTPDFLSWSNLNTVTLSNGASSAVHDPGASNVPARFYRARISP